MIHPQKTLPTHLFSLITTLFLCCATIAHLAVRYTIPHLSVQPTVTEHAVRTVILDAGHGGEDGGALSADGLVEKDVNLAVTLLLRDMLVANGVRVILTRNTDTLLYDKNADYEGRKKALDAAARLRIAEENPDCIFVSIHMNSYPLPSCRGMQVWYSPNHPTSREMAELMLDTAKHVLLPDNRHHVHAAGSGIYLLHRLQIPAILVECGFLSNPDEASRLATPAYQKQLAFTLFCGIMSFDV